MIFIFDLDGVLQSYDNKIYPETYIVLQCLWDMNHSMYVASHNINAVHACQRLGIAHFFKRIFYGRDENKASMVKKIIDLEPNAQIVFLDDQLVNLQLVDEMPGVECVWVDEARGISLSHLAEVGVFRKDHYKTSS